MPPLNAIDCWYERSAEPLEQPKSTYYFLVEGSNTEIWYFSELFYNISKQRVNSVFEPVLVERTGEHDRTASNPKRLLEYADVLQKSGVDEYEFDSKLDKIVFVFDGDIYRNDRDSYFNVLHKMKEIGLVAVTFPAFELFLLLHEKNAFYTYVEPSKLELYENKKINKNKKKLDKLFSDSYGFNPKTNEEKTRNIAHNFVEAAENEKFLNQDEERCLDALTSNVGYLVNNIINVK